MNSDLIFASVRGGIWIGKKLRDPIRKKLVSSCTRCKKNTFFNYRNALNKNYSSFNLKVPLKKNAVLCKECFKKREMVECYITKSKFYKIDNKYDLVLKNDFFPYLSKYYNFSIKRYISDDGFLVLEEQYRRLTQCNECGSTTFMNNIGKLIINYDQYSITHTLKNDNVICNDCYEKMEIAQCEITGNNYKKINNKFAEFSNGNMFSILYPYHKYSTAHSISTEGYEIILEEYKEITQQLKNKILGSDQSYVKEYDIIKKLKVIKTKPEFKNSRDVERIIKLYTVQVGGNGFINFEAKKTFIKKDNKDKRKYAGKAIAVIIQKEHISKEMKNQHYSYLVDCCKAVEVALEKNYNAQGVALKQKLISVKHNFSNEEKRIIKKIAKIRNKTMHEKYTLDDYYSYREEYKTLKQLFMENHNIDLNKYEEEI